MLEKKKNVGWRILQWAGIFLSCFIGLLFLGAVGLYFFFDWNWLKGSAIERISAATGRKMEINGDIEGEFSLNPHIRIQGIKVANVEGGRDPYFISIGSLAFQIRLLDLLVGRVTLPEVTIDKADIRLEKNEKGVGNWKLGPSLAGAATEGAVPEDRHEFPLLGNLKIDHSQLRYFDPQNKLDLKSEISLAEGSGGGGKQMHLKGTGSFQDMTVKLDATGASLLQLREKEKPYPLKIALQVGATDIRVDGTVMDPLNPEDFDMLMQLRGENLADLFPIFRVPLPPSAEYALKGQLRRQGARWDFTNINGKVGNSDLEGNLSVDSGQEPPRMMARLVSSKLDFKDLGGFVGAPPTDADQTKESGASKEGPTARVLPDVPIDLERLHAMNMQVDFQGKEILAPHFLPIDNLRTHLNLENGLLRLQPLTFGIAGGSLSGPLILDGRQQTPRVTTDMVVKNLGLKPFFSTMEAANVTEGKIGGTIKLSGEGRSLAEVLGSSDGRATIAMTGGTLDPLIVELLGLDIGQALLVLVDPPKPVKIRCSLADLKLENGKAAIQGLVIDTTDSNIWASGDIDLKEEKLDVRVQADPKDVSLLSANAPIALNGPFRSPDIAIDPTHTSDAQGIGKVLGEIVNPIIALLPFVDLGLGEDTDCRHFAGENQKPVPPNESKLLPRPLVK